MLDDAVDFSSPLNILCRSIGMPLSLSLMASVNFPLTGGILHFTSSIVILGTMNKYEAKMTGAGLQTVLIQIGRP